MDGIFAASEREMRVSLVASNLMGILYTAHQRQYQRGTELHCQTSSVCEPTSDYTKEVNKRSHQTVRWWRWQNDARKIWTIIVCSECAFFGKNYNGGSFVETRTSQNAVLFHWIGGMKVQWQQRYHYNISYSFMHNLGGAYFTYSCIVLSHVFSLIYPFSPNYFEWRCSWAFVFLPAKVKIASKTT